MISRLRENFRYKLGALLCAIALHWYVANLQNPRQVRTLLVTLAPQNVPEGYDLVDKSVTISVSVEGPADALARLPDDGVSASADLTHAHAGRNSGLAIHAEVTTPGIRDLVMIGDIRPQTVTLNLQEERRRRLSLAVVPDGTPAAGFTVARAETIPGDATIIGGADIVDSVARVTIAPHVAGATGPVEEDDPLMAVDTHGNSVADVTITPEMAHVRVVIAEAAREREVFVTPDVTGSPAPGFRVTSLDVVPPTVPITGPEAALEAAGTVTTDPIDVTGASADVARYIRCLPPTGLMIASSPDVTVTVHIGPIAPGAAPQTGAPVGPQAPFPGPSAVPAQPPGAAAPPGTSPAAAPPPGPPSPVLTPQPPPGQPPAAAHA